MKRARGTCFVTQQLLLQLQPAETPLLPAAAAASGCYGSAAAAAAAAASGKLPQPQWLAALQSHIPPISHACIGKHLRNA
ncbi:TPA: hypothetical protein ACH3X2_001120 [Trebouxia sp. C0005]